MILILLDVVETNAFNDFPQHSRFWYCFWQIFGPFDILRDSFNKELCISYVYNAICMFNLTFYTSFQFKWASRVRPHRNLRCHFSGGVELEKNPVQQLYGSGFCNRLIPENK